MADAGTMMKRSEARGLIAATLLTEPDRLWFGYSLYKATKVRLGLMYPILWEWHQLGYLSDEWEPDNLARSPRRGYRLTDFGIENLT